MSLSDAHVPTAGYVDSTALLEEPDALRAFGQAEGYLFFRNRLPAEPLLELRRQILAIIEKHGFLEAGTDPDEARVDMDRVAAAEPYAGCTFEIFKDVQRLEVFHRIAHHAKLIEIYKQLFDGPVLPHPRHIARVLLPGPHAHPTPPHQDFVHVQGSEQTWTAWFPLGDCPRELGGLSVLRASHKKGVLAVANAQGAGGLETILCPDEQQWIVDDFKLGDVLTFPSTTVHRGMPNRLGNRIRLSCDLRYQSADQPIEEKSLRPHREVMTWEEVYADWEHDDLKYYWTKHPVRLSPWDESVRWQKVRICD